MMDSSSLVYKNVKIVSTKQETPKGWDVLSCHGAPGGADWDADGEDHQADIPPDTEMVSDDEVDVEFFDDKSECSTYYDTSDSEVDVVKSFKKKAKSRNLLPNELVPETDFIDE